MQKRFISWQDVDLLVKTLADQIFDSGKEYDCIYGLMRGGLMPAVMLSHRLNIPMSKHWATNLKKVLIVDDIADTGKTLSRYWTKIHDSATLCYKPQSIIRPTYFAAEMPNDTWIVYPWECADAGTKQDYLK